MRRMTWTALIGTLMLWSVFAGSADAKPPMPANEWTPSAKLALAQAIVGEASFRKSDRAPIAWVLYKRWRRMSKRFDFMTFERVVRSYASPMKAKHHWVRGLPWGPIKTRYADRWDELRAWVLRWGSGQVKDPCPTAIHWGAPYGVDIIRAVDAGWDEVDCGDTANKFWALPPR